MALSEPEAVVIGALITAVLGVVSSWIATRVQRRRAPQRKPSKDAWVNELIERICAVYERQIAWLEADIEQRKRAEEERRSPRRSQQPGSRGADRAPGPDPAG